MRTGDFGRASAVLDEAREAAGRETPPRAAHDIEREFLATFAEPEGSTRTIPEVAVGRFRSSRSWRRPRPRAGLACEERAGRHAARWGARAEALERALEHARRAGDLPRSRRRSSPALALYYGPTPVAEAIARCERLPGRGSAATGLLEAAIENTLAGLRAMQGDFEEARRLWLSARDLRRARPATSGRDRSLADRRRDRESSPAAREAAERVLRWAYDTLEEMGAKSATATDRAPTSPTCSTRRPGRGGRELSRRSPTTRAAADDVVDAGPPGAASRARCSRVATSRRGFAPRPRRRSGAGREHGLPRPPGSDAPRLSREVREPIGHERRSWKRSSPAPKSLYRDERESRGGNASSAPPAASNRIGGARMTPDVRMEPPGIDKRSFAKAARQAVETRTRSPRRRMVAGGGDPVTLKVVEMQVRENPLRDYRVDHRLGRAWSSRPHRPSRSRRRNPSRILSRCRSRTSRRRGAGATADTRRSLRLRRPASDQGRPGEWQTSPRSSRSSAPRRRASPRPPTRPFRRPRRRCGASPAPHVISMSAEVTDGKISSVPHDGQHRVRDRALVGQ